MGNLSFVCLRPWSWLYSFITQFRNLLYNYHLKETHIFNIPVISVGNLSLGGTGKTPCIAYLIDLLSIPGPILVLSRGYKRKTKGFRIAQPQDSAWTIGDEPLQLYRQFAHNQQVKIAVCEDRAQGIQELLTIFPDAQAILLDDGFQHRKVKPSLNILLTEFDRPFWEDHVIPAGRLREPRTSAKRADIVIVTKCPDELPETNKQTFRQQIKAYCGHKQMPIFFSSLYYQPPAPLWPSQKPIFSKNVFLFTGIANPHPLVNYVNQHYNLIQHRSFRDHHRYTNRDIKNILATFHQLNHPDRCLLTTEKDSMRLQEPDLKALLAEMPIFYLPISMHLIEEEKLKRLIFEHIAYD